MSFLLAFALYCLPFWNAWRGNGFLQGRLCQGGCWVALGGLGGERISKGTLKLSLEVDISMVYVVIQAPEEREDCIV